MSRGGVRIESVSSQAAALEKIAKIIRQGSVNRELVRAARAITRDCDARDDECELRSIFEAVKFGTDKVPWLSRGMRYVADPRPFDTFSTVQAIIDDFSAGASAFDCDDATILIGSLCSALGFQVGARAWGKSKAQDGEYQHVYPVAAMPKSGPWDKGYMGHGMDVTVEDFDFGDEPGNTGDPGKGPGTGHFMTTWVL